MVRGEGRGDQLSCMPRTQDLPGSGLTKPRILPRQTGMIGRSGRAKVRGELAGAGQGVVWGSLLCSLPVPMV